MRRLAILQLDRLIVPLKNISLIWRRWWTIAGEGLQNLGLSSALRAFEQGGIFIVARGLGFSGLIRIIAPFSRLLQHTKGCGGSILARILTG
jgi:hypothetical protein